MTQPEILLIMRNHTLRSLYSRCLSAEGYTVKSFATLDEGRGLFERSSPKAIVLDLEQTDEPFIVEWKRLREEHSSTIFVLACRPEDRSALESDNIADILFKKPFSPQSLVEELARARGARTDLPGQKRDFEVDPRTRLLTSPAFKMKAAELLISMKMRGENVAAALITIRGFADMPFLGKARVLDLATTAVECWMNRRKAPERSDGILARRDDKTGRFWALFPFQEKNMPERIVDDLRKIVRICQCRNLLVGSDKVLCPPFTPEIRLFLSRDSATLDAAARSAVTGETSIFHAAPGKAFG